ncbi:acyl carrier protein (plasmid) [Pediococcus pentosaceus]|uniref:acyl carrier protein n=1 Tax=Pediococcus pentosaceus TaxID=1255 RepID=UPI0018E12B16|nr:phosphopantetheine-binding protein [Pediococcus pentosaceus]MBF7105139.1 acyl carrier protein [Pediococcus pentosaceus]QQC60598.1 acyl carrier protein [Pediococcus pentosaceus]
MNNPKVEEKALNILEQLLPVEKLSMDDDFFELGGNSLLLLQFVSSISSEFGVKVQFQDAFAHSKIKQLVKLTKSNS